MKIPVISLFILFQITVSLARPPSSHSSSDSQIKGGIGDGYIYPAKSKPNSMTYYAKPLHPPSAKSHGSGGGGTTKTQVYKVIIKDQPAVKQHQVTKPKHEIYKIIHLPSPSSNTQQHHSGAGSGGGGQQSVKILKIINLPNQNNAGKPHSGGVGGSGGGKW